MAFQVLFGFLYYAGHILKGLIDIVIGKDESIRGDNGQIISKLPTKRKQVLIFAKNFLKDPVRFQRRIENSN